MRNIKLVIEYDGKRYLGWQRLGDSDNTIQGKIEAAIKQMTGEDIEIIGSGRTDSGTHARGQVANFKTKTTLPLNKIHHFFNHNLPRDIVVKQVTEVEDRFHARYNAKGKRYSYYIWNAETPSAFNRNYSYHCSEKLDVSKMKEACTLLVGEHDFIGFSSLKKTKKSTVRIIENIEVKKDGNMISIIFKGNGFLYNMIRIIMGTLLEIGLGEKDVNVISEIIDSQNRQMAGATLPANGLFLDCVEY